jgi:hypothetical protein
VLRTQLRAEIHAMLRYAFANGLTLPATVARAAVVLQDEEAPLSHLSPLHGQLTKLVAPARPGTLRLLHADDAPSGLAVILGPLVNLRRLTLAAFACTLAFIGMSVSPLVDASLMAGDIYSLSGARQLAAMGFLLSAAGLGSTFQALFTAQGYVTAATYDPVYDGSYWVRIGLGFVAGLMLAVLVPINTDGGSPTVEKPMLALLGGFSASLVYRILQRMVDTVDSLFQGSQRTQQQREEDLTRTGSLQEIARSRIEVATQLVGVRDAVSRGAPAEQVNELLHSVLDALLEQHTPAFTGTSNPPESHSA